MTNKVTITNTTGSSYTIIFYDHLDTNESFSANLENDLSPRTQAKLNNNLGWILGYRGINYTNLSLEYTIADSGSKESETLCFVPFTKYFVVVIDDMNKNQTNKGLVEISKGKEFINRNSEFKDIDNSLNCLTCSNISSYGNNSLTKKQLYSIAQINNHRSNYKNKNSKLDATGINNVFGIIPFESKSMTWGHSTFTSDKNRFKRKYNGPVDINKLHVKLLDDKGNLVNLNGSEWSMTLVSTHLYQY